MLDPKDPFFETAVANLIDQRLRGSDLAVLIRQLQSPEPWHVVGATGEPAFQSGFSNYGGGYSTAAFCRMPDGTVRLKGTFKNAGSAVTSAIFTLPAGYRPLEILSFPAQCNNAFGEVRVTSAGGIAVVVGNTTFLSLDGMTFRAEQ